jgi:hypothetical protein
MATKKGGKKASKKGGRPTSKYPKKKAAKK